MKLNIKLENNWLEATWVENDKQIHCESFSGHVEHIALLRVKSQEFNTSLREFEPLIKQCQDNFVYPTTEEINKELEAQAKQLDEQVKTEALAKLTVTTSSGKVFYADTESRVDLNDAIRKAENENLANTPWKLAEAFEGERVVIVTLEEIREAADLALSAKGSIVGVIQIKEGE